MEKYFSKSMFKEELHKIKWFSPIVFLLIFVIFNNTGMAGLLGKDIGFDRTYGIKSYFSLSFIRILILALVYYIGASLLLLDKKKLKEDAAKEGRIIYFVTKGASLLTAIGTSFMAAFFTKLVLYLMNLKLFYEECNIGPSYLVKFFAFHIVLILLIVALAMLLNSFFGNIFSVIVMPILTIYSFLLFFGTGYYLVSETYVRSRNFLAWVESLTVNKLYEVIINDYRLILQNSGFQYGVTLYMIIFVLLFITMGFFSYKYMNVHRVNNYFMYYGVELVSLGSVIIAGCYFLSLGTAVIILLANEELEMIKAWDMAYNLMMIYISIIAFIRILYIILKNRPWEIFINKKKEENIEA